MTQNVIIDDNLILNTTTSTIETKKKNTQSQPTQTLNFNTLNEQITRLEHAVDNLESSLQPGSISDDITAKDLDAYNKAGLVTNIIWGIIIALIIILLII